MGKILEMSKGKSKWLDATLPYAGEERAIVENHTVEMTSSSGCTTANITDPDTGEYYKIVAGKKYRVIWDGVEYICTGFISKGEGTALEQSAVSDNGTNSPEKFEIETRPLFKRTTGFGYNDESYPATHTFSIYEIIKEARAIDRKCLPEGYPYRETVENTLRVCTDAACDLTYQETDSVALWGGDYAFDEGLTGALIWDALSAFPIDFTGGGVGLIETNIKYTVAVDGDVYEGSAPCFNDGYNTHLLLGNLGLVNIGQGEMESTGEPFLTLITFLGSSVSTKTSGTVVSSEDISKITIDLWAESETVHTMDGELLPTEEWEFELEDGSTVTKKVVVAE